MVKYAPQKRKSQIEMHPLFKKMNYKSQNPVLVADAPESFSQVTEAMQEFCKVHTAMAEGQSYAFLLFFVRNASDLTPIASRIKGCLEGDVLLWVAYPKKSSKQYKSDINRDSPAWQVLGELGFEGVRQVAIDADWSALRFRQVNFIKNLKRSNSMALSREGKKRTS